MARENVHGGCTDIRRQKSVCPVRVRLAPSCCTPFQQPALSFRKLFTIRPKYLPLFFFSPRGTGIAVVSHLRAASLELQSKSQPTTAATRGFGRRDHSGSRQRGAVAMHVFPEWLAVFRQSCLCLRADPGCRRDAPAALRRQKNNGWEVPPSALRIPDVADA